MSRIALDEHDCVVGWIHGVQYPQSTTWEIKHLAVRPSEQERGLGRLLLQDFESEVARVGGTTLWLADYPSPSTFLVGSFSCDGRRAPDNYGNFCDPVADGLMRRAERLQVTEPRAGNALWAKADARIIDQAAAIPLYNPITTDFVSDRLGNYQFHPQWGMLFDQAWVR